MKVYAILPVFNRLRLTQRLINCLRQQLLSCPLKIVVVNDGSTDNTAEWLSFQHDVSVLNGDGTLLWGGAIDVALTHVQEIAQKEDWVLFINNDITVDNKFVQSLLDVALANPYSAVGSIVRDEENPSRVLSVGPCLDPWRHEVRDFVDIMDSAYPLDSEIAVHTLAGRGTLYPLAALVACGGMRPSLIPHYLADYEVGLRVKKAGWRLLVSTVTAVYSQDDFGSKHINVQLFERLFSTRSTSYLTAQLVFWWEASSWLQRVTLPIRLPLYFLFPSLRSMRS